MKPEIKITDDTSISSRMLGDNAKHTAKFLSFNKKEISASDVSQYRLMPAAKTNEKNKYPASECKVFMQEIADAGFGVIEEVQKEGSRRKCSIFKKRQLSELGSDQRESLKKLKITDELYSTSFSSTSDDSFLNTTDSQISDTPIQELLSSP